MKSVTLNEVAVRAGVSRATVSLVLRDTGRVSPATRARVRESMAALGYVYNRGAASLRTQRSRTVGAIVTNIGDQYFGEILQGFQGGFDSAGYTCLVVGTGHDPEAQLAAVQQLRENQVAGLGIVPAIGSTADLVHALTEWSLPHVFMTRYLPGAPTHYVGANDVLGGQLAAQHLIEHHSCRQFAYIGGPSHSQSRLDRITGITTTMAAHGLDARSLIDMPGETSGRSGLNLGRQLVSTGEVPEAIICHSDVIAFGLYRALRESAVNDKTAVMGYDDVSTSALWEPPLSSVAVKGAELGRLAARTLLSQLVLRPPEPEITWITPAVKIRQSCGCRDREDERA